MRPSDDYNYLDEFKCLVINSRESSKSLHHSIYYIICSRQDCHNQLLNHGQQIFSDYSRIALLHSLPTQNYASIPIFALLRFWLTVLYGLASNHRSLRLTWSPPESLNDPDKAATIKIDFVNM